LQLPNTGQENPVAVEFGQPLAGHGQLPPGHGPAASVPEPGLPSAPASKPSEMHMLFTQVPVQGAPQPPQFAPSVLVLTHLPLHVVGELDGQVVAQANEPASLSAQTGASSPQATSQPPQLDGEEGSRQPASQMRKPSAQPPSSSPSAPPSSFAGASAPGPTPLSAAPSLAACRLASQSSVQAEYPFSPEMAAHDPSTVARATAPSAPDSSRIIL